MCVCVASWCFLSGPLHPYIWERESASQWRFSPMRAHYRSFFPISPMVTFLRPALCHCQYHSQPPPLNSCTPPPHDHPTFAKMASLREAKLLIFLTAGLGTITGPFSIGFILLVLLMVCLKLWETEISCRCNIHPALFKVIPPGCCLAFNYSAGNAHVAIVTACLTKT